MARRKVTPYGHGATFDHRTIEQIKNGPNAKAIAAAKAALEADKQKAREAVSEAEKAVEAATTDAAKEKAAKALEAAQTALADLG